MIDRVGLQEVARKRVGQFSLGMGQRLGIAAALLADPQILILDEPANGLDPEGIQWIRNLLKELAAEGRTVFLSSHLMSEMALTAEHLIVVGRGRLIADLSVEEFLRQASKDLVRVRSPRATELHDALAGPGVTITPTDDGALEIGGLTAEQIGDAAAVNGIALHELTPVQVSLEEAFMDVTRGDVEYHGLVDATEPREPEGVTV
jgi:ABC-2 type transport system ATP-binding protein